MTGGEPMITVLFGDWLDLDELEEMEESFAMQGWERLPGLAQTLRGWHAHFVPVRAAPKWLMLNPTLMRRTR